MPVRTPGALAGHPCETGTLATPTGGHRLRFPFRTNLDWKKSVKSLDLAAYTFQSMDKATLLGHGAPTGSRKLDEQSPAHSKR